MSFGVIEAFFQGHGRHKGVVECLSKRTSFVSLQKSSYYLGWLCSIALEVERGDNTETMRSKLERRARYLRKLPDNPRNQIQISKRPWYFAFYLHINMSAKFFELLESTLKPRTNSSGVFTQLQIANEHKAQGTMSQNHNSQEVLLL